jgi:glycosyltransferase involved in cell wall biosynthesis
MRLEIRLMHFLRKLGKSCFLLLLPLLNYVLSQLRRHLVYENSVLHISYLVHIPWDTTRLLRKQGIRADYLAVGAENPFWKQCDYHFPASSIWREFLFFWRVAAKYEVIHSHFGLMLSVSGWELPVLKRLGRKIVVHYRGCEAREPEKNQALHPSLNICQDCDYQRTVCREGKARVERLRKYGDYFIVTTPDLKDFIPEAAHFPFFSPELDELEPAIISDAKADTKAFKIVHVTNHPGIEGTESIVQTIERLNQKGHNINFVFLKHVPHERVLQEYRDADLSIGKMKMGYYANAQIESLACGVPAITWIRPEFMTPALANSGLIITHLHDLEQTLEYFLTHPAELQKKKEIARRSVAELHDNNLLTRRLAELYDKLKQA